MKRRNAIKVLGGIVGSAFFLPGELTGIAKALEPVTETDYWNGAWVTIFNGTGMGQTRVIDSSDGDNVTLTAKWDIEPDSSSQLRIRHIPNCFQLND